MKKDRKGGMLIKVLAMVVGLFIIGYVVGRILGRLTRGMELAELFKTGNSRGVGTFLTAVQSAVVIGGLLTAWLSFVRTKKRAEKWDGEDEEEISAIEGALDLPMIVSSTVTVLGTILFSCVCYFLLTEPSFFDIIPVAVFLIGQAGTILLNEQAVTLEKKLNPEKNGSTLDVNFHKKWMDSCDEAEKLMIWQAGFAAYKAGNMVCSVMWIVIFILQTVLRFGIVPMICVGVFWLTLNTAYVSASVKLERGK